MITKKTVASQQKESGEMPSELFGGFSLIQWLQDNRKLIPYFFLVLFLLLLFLFRWSSGRSISSESDYLKAARDLQTLIRAPREGEGAELGKKALGQLRTILAARPALAPRYDAKIAQVLIAQGNPAEANEFAQRTLARVSDEVLAFYDEFSRITLLIGQEQYKEAIERSLALKTKLLETSSQLEQQKEKKPFNDTLFAYNLLRIASLQQAIGAREEELLAWQEWKQYAGLGRKTEEKKLIDTEAFKSIIQRFEENNISLLDYIKAREQILSS
jgi:hypothetical protein